MQSSWRSLLVYLGGLTFDQEQPATHLRIPNKVAARRIAAAVLETYNLHESFLAALQRLVDDGEIEQTLSCYRDLMVQQDVTGRELIQLSEGDHRDCFYFCLGLCRYLFPAVEFRTSQ